MNDNDDFASLFDSGEQDNEQVYLKYEQDMEALSKELGIDLGPENRFVVKDEVEPQETYEHSFQENIQPEPSHSTFQSQPSHSTFQHQPSQFQTQPPYQPQPSQSPYQPQPSQFQAQSPYQSQNQSYQPQPSQFQTQPQFQQYQYHDDDSGDNQESIRDEKIYLLERIKHLVDTLEKTDADTTYPEISSSSSLEDIKDVHKMLIQKTNRIRYTELGQSIIMAGARALGTYFDGNNEFCGRKIDLRGLDSRLQWKLKHLKPEIADMVQQVCSSWSPHFLTAFELVTIIAIHSHDNATTVKNDNMYNEMFES